MRRSKYMFKFVPLQQRVDPAHGYEKKHLKRRYDPAVINNIVSQCQVSDK